MWGVNATKDGGRGANVPRPSAVASGRSLTREATPEQRRRSVSADPIGLPVGPPHEVGDGAARLRLYRVELSQQVLEIETHDRQTFGSDPPEVAARPPLADGRTYRCLPFFQWFRTELAVSFHAGRISHPAVEPELRERGQYRGIERQVEVVE